MTRGRAADIRLAINLGPTPTTALSKILTLWCQELLDGVDVAWAERDAEKAGTMSRLGEIVRLRRERDDAIKGVVALTVEKDRLQIEKDELRIEIEHFKSEVRIWTAKAVTAEHTVRELKRGEYICKKCGIRKDSEGPQGDC